MIGTRTEGSVNFDDINRLVDDAIALNAFFHGSYEKLPVGRTLAARTTDRKNSPIEQFIDRYRPEGAAPRWKSWFMVEDPCDVERAGGNAKHIYEVEPTAPPQPANFKQVENLWWSRWFKIADETGLTPTLADFGRPSDVAAAKRYWANRPVKYDKTPTEWLAPEVKVLREVKCKGGLAGRTRIRKRARRDEGPLPGKRAEKLEAARRVVSEERAKRRGRGA